MSRGTGLIGSFFVEDETPHPRRVFGLLVATVAFIALLPFGDAYPTFLSVIEGIMILSAVGVAAQTRRSFALAAVLGILSIALTWTTLVFGLDRLIFLQFIASALLYLYVVILMLRRVFRAKEVTAETLCLAVSTYLLVALVWTSAYVVLEIFHPGSFSTPAYTSAGHLWDELYYFSFVTMTTLGYGDITPVAPAARSLVILEAVSGIMFLGILIARLVGKHSSGK